MRNVDTNAPANDNCAIAASSEGFLEAAAASAIARAGERLSALLWPSDDDG